MALVIPVYKPIPTESRWGHVSTWQGRHWRRWMSQGGYSQAAIEQYLVDRELYAVWGVDPKTKGRVALYQATPWGVRYHQQTALNVMAGGAVGAAKSYTMRWDIHMRCLSVPRYRALIFRRTFQELIDNHMNDAAQEAPLLGARFLKDDKVVQYPNGSWLRFAHCEKEGDEVKYLSSEYEIVAPDELATFTKKQIMGIISRLRTSKAGVSALFRSSTNPGGANTLWCVAWFVHHSVTAEEDPYYEAKDWAFLPGFLWDNPYLMDADGTYTTYLKRLGGLGAERRRQLLEGDFSAIEGQFFEEFRGSGLHSHVQDWDSRINWETVVWERSVDWGYNQEGSCGWWAVLPDGRVYRRMEYQFRQTIVSEVAKNILKYTKDLATRLGLSDIKIRKTVCDPSMDNDQSHTGESYLDTFRRFGIREAVKGDSDREMGWQRMRHWLQVAPDGDPWLILHPDCKYSIRTWPSLTSDPHRVEDVDTAGVDHSADEARYFLMARPSPLAQPTTTRVVPGSLGWFKQRAKRKQGNASFYAQT